MLSLASFRSMPALPDVDLDALEAAARRVRGHVVRMSHLAKGAHLGSGLSCADVLVAAYWAALRIDPKQPNGIERDRFILSKGHAAAALYATLAERGFFDPELLATYGRPGSLLPEHPSPRCVPGVEVGTGSLGHGLSLGLGMALASKIQHRSYRVFALLSDGECNEGSVWEAAMLAPAKKLDNVCAIVDFNRWQATGRSEEVMTLQSLRDKWRAFGWCAWEVDGHDMGSLVEAFSSLPNGSGKPLAIIAHTVKGKGISFMEDDNNWHYRVPNAEELRRALTELGLEVDR